jgi:hypothetical protein
MISLPTIRAREVESFGTAGIESFNGMAMEVGRGSFI